MTATTMFRVDGKRVPLTWIKPSRGDPYLRCPKCKRQIFAQVVVSATTLQITFVLGANLTKHLKEFHADV